MTDKGLTTHDMPDAQPGQEDGSVQLNIVKGKTSREIRAALSDFGFDRVGTGVRLILLTFARSERVRTAIQTDLHLANRPTAKEA